MAEMRRTIKLPLEVDRDASDRLADAAREHATCYNYVCAVGFNHSPILTDRTAIHRAVYRDLKRMFPLLPADLIVSAIARACESLKSVSGNNKRRQKLLAEKKANPKRRIKIPSAPTCPHSDFCPIRYNTSSCVVDLLAGSLLVSARTNKKIAKVYGRKERLTFTVPSYGQQYLEWTCTAGELHRINGQWFFYAWVSAASPQPQPTEESKAIGVDFGIVKPAVDSQGNSYGDPHWSEVEKRRAGHTARLQSCGTKSAKRHLKCTRGRQARFRRDCDHVLSKRIVQSANPGDTIVLEELTGIRDRMKAGKEIRKRVHRWSFAQQKTFISYKAEARGVKLAFIDPAYTSQTCSACGHCEKANRRTQAHFSCRQCGFTTNADHNAARNIRDKYVKGLPVNQPIVATPNGQPFLSELQAPTSTSGGH